MAIRGRNRAVADIGKMHRCDLLSDQKLRKNIRRKGYPQSLIFRHVERSETSVHFSADSSPCSE
ncbi:MAG: hypothetical protein LBG19_07785 [Prevotellaceae bacterium]|jgi:hypothetical protein|nr:hypothetical protein [Prevotellaceae bacterium]